MGVELIEAWCWWVGVQVMMGWCLSVGKEFRKGDCREEEEGPSFLLAGKVKLVKLSRITGMLDTNRSECMLAVECRTVMGLVMGFRRRLVSYPKY